MIWSSRGASTSGIQSHSSGLLKATFESGSRPVSVLFNIEIYRGESRVRPSQRLSKSSACVAAALALGAVFFTGKTKRARLAEACV